VKKNQLTTTTELANMHDTTMPLLNAMYGEFKELSKKKPDAAISKNKIKIVNRLLDKVRFVLAGEDSIEFLDLLDEDSVPQASDVTLILSQYVAAMDGFKEKYFGYSLSDGDRIWFIKNG
jgi:hypothetical protein